MGKGEVVSEGVRARMGGCQGGVRENVREGCGKEVRKGVREGYLK